MPGKLPFGPVRFSHPFRAACTTLSGQGRSAEGAALDGRLASVSSHSLGWPPSTFCAATASLCAVARSANRVLAVLWAMMEHGGVLGPRRVDSNPWKGLRRRNAGIEARYLTDGEFAALRRALDN